MKEATLQAVKATGDVAAGSIAFAALFKWLPAIAALLSIAWTLVRFYEWGKSKLKKPK